MVHSATFQILLWSRFDSIPEHRQDLSELLTVSKTILNKLPYRWSFGFSLNVEKASRRLLFETGDMDIRFSVPAGVV